LSKEQSPRCGELDRRQASVAACAWSPTPREEYERLIQIQKIDADVVDVMISGDTGGDEVAHRIDVSCVRRRRVYASAYRKSGARRPLSAADRPDRRWYGIPPWTNIAPVRWQPVCTGCLSDRRKRSKPGGE
jgi:hypothetical protein